jgi:hypothetical protein
MRNHLKVSLASGMGLVSGLAIVTIALMVPLSRSVSEPGVSSGSVPESSIRQIRDADLLQLPLWESARGEVSLYASRAEVGNWICPRIDGNARQPLCRRFSSQAVAACSEGDELLIVLSDGDIHRVNYALINADGRFLPVYHHPAKLDLVDAWLPAAICIGDTGLPEIFAVNRDSTLLRFDRLMWRRLD